MSRRTPSSTLFPYTTLFRSEHVAALVLAEPGGVRGQLALVGIELDRKSTRLNSSHLGTSYAIFCSKKNSPGAVENSSIENANTVTQFCRKLTAKRPHSSNL